MHDNPAEALQRMQSQLAAQKREVAAAKAVTTMLIDRGWAMLEQGHRLLDWFNRNSKDREFN
jgi:hypothetical protein